MTAGSVANWDIKKDMPYGEKQLSLWCKLFLSLSNDKEISLRVNCLGHFLKDFKIQESELRKLVLPTSC